jgi:hypothetical protein
LRACAYLVEFSFGADMMISGSVVWCSRLGCTVERSVLELKNH